ncbi:uncharacterized protein LOC143279921 [Babylonia areolata]|uniref:uncharacterized protein LOC143279921 n=1 Tax=Babylonia areolata TaxID=304850 RepID=UPI003FD3CB3C
MQKSAVLLVFLAAIAAAVLCAQVEEDEELDPFDMVNFDHTNMKMRKKSTSTEPEPPPTDEPKDTTESSPKEEDASESAHTTTTCPPPAKEEKTTTESAPPVRKEQATETSGSCPALFLFQQYVSKLLRLIEGKVSQTRSEVPTEMCLRLRLTPYQMEVLETFKRDHSKDRVFTAHEILTEAAQGVHILSHDDPSLKYLWVEEYFGVTLEQVLQILQLAAYLVAFVVVLALALRRIRFTRRLVVWAVVSVFTISVAMTWYRLYKGEVAKQHEAMLRDLPAGCGKMPETGGSILTQITNYVRYQFTFQQDACVTYFEHLVIDPIVKVSPMEALAVALVQTMLKPLRIVGTEISEFLRALVKDLPVQWQMVSVIMVCAFLVLILFLACGYRVRVPFLLAIEPSPLERSPSVRRADDVPSLRNTIEQLQATIEDMRTERQRQLPEPRQYQTVGSVPHDSPNRATAARPTDGAGTGFLTDTTTSQYQGQDQALLNLKSMPAQPESEVSGLEQTDVKRFVGRQSRPAQPEEEEDRWQTDVKQVVRSQEREDTGMRTNRTRVSQGGSRTDVAHRAGFEEGAGTASSMDGEYSISGSDTSLPSRFEEGEDKPTSGDIALSRTAVCEAQEGRQNSSASATASPGASEPPSLSLSELGCCARNLESVGSVGEVGQGGDASTVKSSAKED